MWYLKINHPSSTRDLWFFTVHGTFYVHPCAIYAEAFGPTEIEEMRQQAERQIPGATATPFECSTRNILTPEMCRVIGLERIK